jgi:hypothetical protein
MTSALRTLLTGLVDYAGLFPPAKLDMARSVETYNRARMGPHEWMLGRFICPVSRLGEFSAAAAPLLPGTFATSGYRTGADTGEPWRLSAIIDGPLEKDLDAIDIFNERHSAQDAGLCEVDVIEMKITDPNQVDAALDEIPEDIFPFFEFPVTTDCRGFVAALAGNAAGAKIRTGGVVREAFPTVAEVAAFLHACAAADVPFKATAGLHHPVRAHYPLTYEAGSAKAPMHGFLNVFVAAVVCRAMRPDVAVTEAILDSDDPALFRFSEQVLGWKEHLVTTTDAARVREQFALSFGSCSFDEPVEDLQRLGLLERE